MKKINKNSKGGDLTYPKRLASLSAKSQKNIRRALRRKFVLVDIDPDDENALVYNK